MIDSSRISFLGKGIENLENALVSVVGGGGGGSHVAQQLAHLAIGTVAIIEPDRVETSNVNRLPGCGYEDVGRLKARVLAKRLRGLGGTVIPVPTRAETPEGRSWLERSDVVIGAVDGVRARSNIEYICRAAHVPYIDIGLGIDVDGAGSIRSIGGQVITSLPGGPCLRCAEVVTEAGIVADREEYVAGAPDQQVISMNGVLASQAVSNAIAILTNYLPEYPVPSTLRFDGILCRMQPEIHIEQEGCTHYTVHSAGWHTVLPPRKAAS